MMEDTIRNFINQFNGKYMLLEYGFPEGDYLSNGFWLRLKANFMPIINSFSIGKINFDIHGDVISVDRGFLDEIGQGLSMII